jgi:hypothetical protein
MVVVAVIDAVGSDLEPDAVIELLPAVNVSDIDGERVARDSDGDREVERVALAVCVGGGVKVLEEVWLTEKVSDADLEAVKDGVRVGGGVTVADAVMVVEEDAESVPSLKLCDEEVDADCVGVGGGVTVEVVVTLKEPLKEPNEEV